MSKRIAIGLVMLAALAIGFVPYQKVIGDGLETLSVTVVSEYKSPIAIVSCEPFSSEEATREAMEHLIPPETYTDSQIADPFRGDPINMRIWTTYKWYDSLLWEYDGDYYQKRFLVVIVQYADGRRVGKVVDIPDVRNERTLKVEFP